MGSRVPRLVLAAALIVLMALPARAQGPEELVRWIYVSMLQPGRGEDKGIAYITSPAQRGLYLTRRMVAFQNAADTYYDDPMNGCIDFGLSIPGQDYDEKEIVRTLNVTSSGDATRRSVTARFTNFGEPAEVTYDFIPEDGVWRIDDFVIDGLRLSQIPCAPRGGAGAAAQPRNNTGNATGAGMGAGVGTEYCYRSDKGSFRLAVAPDWRAQFAFDSWQGGGHSCSASGEALPVEGGWAQEQTLASGLCRLGIAVTPDGGLKLSDRDGICRLELCGARAAIDGLTIPAASRVDCARMPAN